MDTSAIRSIISDFLESSPDIPPHVESALAEACFHLRNSFELGQRDFHDRMIDARAQEPNAYAGSRIGQAIVRARDSAGLTLGGYPR